MNNVKCTRIVLLLLLCLCGTLFAANTTPKQAPQQSTPTAETKTTSQQPNPFSDESAKNSNAFNLAQQQKNEKNNPFSDASAENSAAFGLPENAIPEDSTQEVKDPNEKYNKWMYKINDKLDKYIAKPIARVYNKVMPKPLNNMVADFFRNVDTIPTIANDVFQGNFYQATSDTWRLAINSTVGLAGTFDPASDFGLEYNYEDFGLTLAQWGWTDSSYLVLPIYGPNTVRGTLGKPFTYATSIYPFIANAYVRYGIYGFSLLNERAQLLRYQSVMNSASLDPYVFTRNAYLQRQAYLIQRNKELGNPNTAADTKHYHNPYYLYE